MKNFTDKIAEIESAFTAQDESIRAELRGTEEALQAAQERAKGLETAYKVALLKNAPEATRLRVEVSVAQDSVALLEEMAAQLKQDLNAGEIVEAQLRRHSAIVAAVEGEGNHAIAQAVQAAQEARDSYRQALQSMVETQRKVAEAGRRSYSKTARLGRPVGAATVARYDADQFEIKAPAESASAASFL